MSIETNAKDGILTIRIRDQRMVDEALLEQLERDIAAMLDKSTEERVILDFEHVQFMSSSMLGKLVKIHKQCQGFKVKLKISGVSPEIREVFKITRLDKLFDLEKDEASARKAFLKKGIFG